MKLLDTNICIAYLHGGEERIRTRAEREGRKNLVLCSVVRAELLYGAEKGMKRESTLRQLGAFFDLFKCLPFDDKAAQVYGALRAGLERKGTPIGYNDTMIASIALANGAQLVTRNVREFERVPALLVESW